MGFPAQLILAICMAISGFFIRYRISGMPKKKRRGTHWEAKEYNHAEPANPIRIMEVLARFLIITGAIIAIKCLLTFGVALWFYLH